ncbi:MAG: ATP-grasp domain-containing protein [Planctomycetaceae bacterium]|nr:ATP-grasp domain-containing protein [Planctomycetaceae bacterium]
MDDILILHNTFGPADDPLYQSRAAVMEQVDMVAQSCKKIGIKCAILEVENITHLMSILAGRKEKIIFNLVEEFIGDIKQACFVPLICQSFNKSCTGSKTAVLITAQDKSQTKNLLTQKGLPCPVGVTFGPNDKFNPNLFKKGKYIIKPALSDASEGITTDCVVQMPADREKAKKIVKQIQKKFNQPVIMEQFICARELNVSVLEKDGKIEVLPIAEIDFSAFPKDLPKIVDYDAKWQKDSFAYNNTPRKIPADLDKKLSNEIEKLAVGAWNTLGCRDYVRVDFRLDEEDKPYIIEINPNPDISADAGFAAALEAAGIPYELFVFAVIENANKRL